jgi:glucokinase
MPGPFDYEKGISLIKDQNKYNSLYQLNIKEMLADVIGLKGTDLMFINDAACFLKGELFSGAACGASRAIGLTLGTGLGSAKSINGEVEDANLWCSPFLDGIAEEYLSTKWFIKRYFTLTGKSVKDVRELTGIDSQAIKEQIFNEFGRNLALFLNSFIEQEQPEVIILGGNITNAYDLFSAELNKNLHHFSDSVRQTAIGEDACLIGAASSWQKTVINSILS